MTAEPTAWQAWFASRPAPSFSADGLTDRQAEALRLYAAHLLAAGRPPTRREWAAAMGVSFPNGIGCHLDALVRKGVMTRDPKTACGVRLVGCTLRLECDDTPAGLRLRRLLGGEDFEQGGGI